MKILRQSLLIDHEQALHPEFYPDEEQPLTTHLASQGHPVSSVVRALEISARWDYGLSLSPKPNITAWQLEQNIRSL